jgi:hypothetical protein
MAQSRPPLRLCRVWCGRKRWTGWLPSRLEAFRAAAELGLAYEDRHGQIGLGPLTWIEYGERRYARSKTVPIDPSQRRDIRDWE